MRVLSLCEYLTQSERKPDHVTPYQIVRAVKGMPFDGHAWAAVGGVQQRFDSSNPWPAVSWAVERLAEQVFADHEGEAITLVPIPGHAHVTVEDVLSGSVHRLALALAEALRLRGMETHASACLHWNTAIQSAREGGSRDSAVLQPQLRGLAPESRSAVVIVDDVVATGGHIIAARGVLTAAGYDVADLAFTVGRAVYTKGAPFGALVEECPRQMATRADVAANDGAP